MGPWRALRPRLAPSAWALPTALRCSTLAAHVDRPAPNKYVQLESLANDGASPDAMFEFMSEQLITSRLELYVHAGGEDAAYGVSEAGLARLARAVERLPLQELVLYGAVGGEGAAAVAAAVRHHPHLRRLCIFNAQVGPQGAAALADALSANCELSHLELSYCGLLVDGLLPLAEALRSNTKLEALDLRASELCRTPLTHASDEKHHVSYDGIASLVEALSVNKGLQNLNLSQNEIGCAGAKLLEQCLTRNDALQVLTLRLNSIDTEGAVALAERLVDNTSLTRLDLRDNKELSPSLLNVLQEVFKRRKELGRPPLAVLHDTNIPRRSKKIRNKTKGDRALPDEG
ncbi:hypothetical protein AB1Y20_006318 [Prymnesium parvum]|uniref:Uncharacterized protein n=1 Tax=Prymnesium parvum TaxID=97485 RepID=A0AB34IXH4_PRYPA